jgi:hypothetical protein
MAAAMGSQIRPAMAITGLIHAMASSTPAPPGHGESLSLVLNN